MLTLDKFEEASEKVKEVTLETKLVYSDFLSDQTGNKVYLTQHPPRKLREPQRRLPRRRKHQPR